MRKMWNCAQLIFVARKMRQICAYKRTCCIGNPSLEFKGVLDKGFSKLDLFYFVSTFLHTDLLKHDDH